ncbi:N-acetylglutaminylglutamine synthetase [Pararhizobium mangrovi]|uniref:N-acetylglutaminylglutamine synthetase n=1 Tax=Pararhizobium mangrovi TaxID=2590452 RepID=A0A506U8G7_9HYPH|nr:N-acetylglutaminylglutamine synthetase [Pararhizobium mangrovi]TPW29636.1 N-acetylglutaminylglutamine synthetase [Pararhizobium mangrovi]
MARTDRKAGDTGQSRQAQVQAHRPGRTRKEETKSAVPTGEVDTDRMRENFVLECGWGRLLFGQTFATGAAMLEAIRDEAPERRDIAFYIRDPHVLLSMAPQELFLDPSHTFRLDLATYQPSNEAHSGFCIRRLVSEHDADAVNTIYESRGMIPVQPAFFWANRESRVLTYLVAEDVATGALVGTVTGVDHVQAFDDPEKGTSLWCLAVDAQAHAPGIGEALVRRLAEHYAVCGARYMDLSVLHDNAQAIALYEKIGFDRVPVFAMKRKNPINEKLYASPLGDYDALNPYARIIVDEARRRGIHAEVTDPQGGFFRLTFGGRGIRCRESLSDMTSGVAMSICDDKAVTRRVAARAELAVPEQIEAGADEDVIAAFLERHGSVVVKPARGEQGRGVHVDLTTMAEVRTAIGAARLVCERVLVEACFKGQDLRLVVIDFKLVAAAIRRPAHVVGDGVRTLADLIRRQSRRRSAATGGESSIPLDAETQRCLESQGMAYDFVPEAGRDVAVRRTANLHTGGSIHDVTGIAHPRLVEAACRIARAIDIPVVGIDFMVREPSEPDYVFIEANERPGLANHEPQPTAQRFVDLLFPLSRPESVSKAMRG